MHHRSYAYGKNHYALDPDLPQLLAHFWPQLKAHEQLTRFGALAGGEAYRLADDIDSAPPTLAMHDLDGRRVDRVRLSPAHEALNRQLAAINRPPYEDAASGWALHFAMGYLLADPGLYCLHTITAATLYALDKYAPELRHYREALLAGDAFGATWMTEVQGGSDLGANRTCARPDGELWRLDGEKYFASGAGLSDCAIISARPEGAPDGPKGLALFLLPRLNRQGQLNYRVRRLKAKLATRAIPSGEVELDSSEAYLIGNAEEGIYYLLETLTLSRLANACGAMGLARKAQLEAHFRVRARRAFGKPLIDQPLIRRDLTDLAVRIAGGLALTFRAVAAWQAAWREQPPYSPRYHYARLLAHLAKARTAEHGTYCTQLAMELFGGVGFVEDFAIARLAREALITPIWEGPANVQALDTLEVLWRKGAAEPLVAEVDGALQTVGSAEAELARALLERTLAALQASDAQWQAKAALRTLADIASVALLYQLGGARYRQLAQLYAQRFLAHGEYPAWAIDRAEVWGLPSGL